ncbi:MAG: amicyanin [Chloroflexi bacterium]|nr:amicyanin [Chloroflexota bacterium]
MRYLALMLVAQLLITPTGASAAPLVSVNIIDAPRPEDKWGYSPVTRKIAPGTWVTWSNAGTDAHTVTAADDSFDSGELDPSEGFSWYFDESGTYDYVCTLHPWMQGRIIVGNGVADTQTPAAPDDTSPDDGAS